MPNFLKDIPLNISEQVWFMHEKCIHLIIVIYVKPAQTKQGLIDRVKMTFDQIRE